MSTTASKSPWWKNLSPWAQARRLSELERTMKDVKVAVAELEHEVAATREERDNG